MKRNLKIFTLAAFLFTAPLLMFAQNPPHPNGGNAPNTGTSTNAPVGAPIADGSYILLVLALAYTGRKIYVIHRKETAEEA